MKRYKSFMVMSAMVALMLPCNANEAVQAAATPGVCGSGEPSGQTSEPMVAQLSQKEDRAHDCRAIGTCPMRQRARTSAVSLRSAVRPLRLCGTCYPYFEGRAIDSL